MREIFRKYARFLVISCTIIVVQTNSVQTDFWRKPTENTLLYMPLNSTYTKNDVKWHTTTAWWTIRYWVYGGVDCADFTSWWWIETNNIAIPWQRTFLIRVNNINWTSWNTQNKGAIWRVNSWNAWLSFQDWSSYWYYARENNTFFNKREKSKRYLLIYCNGSSSSNKKQYLYDWSTLTQISCTNNAESLNTSKVFAFWNENYSNWTQKFLWYLSQAIFENKIRTEEEIRSYINKTKNHYT